MPEAVWAFFISAAVEGGFFCHYRVKGDVIYLCGKVDFTERISHAQRARSWFCGQRPVVKAAAITEAETVSIEACLLYTSDAADD